MDYYSRAKYFKTKKRLGQNFLINGEVIANIIDYAKISPEDTVIEIGPGVGFVTEQLIKHAKQVIAIELDEEAIKELEKLNAPNLKTLSINSPPSTVRLTANVESKTINNTAKRSSTTKMPKTIPV